MAFISKLLKGGNTNPRCSCTGLWTNCWAPVLVQVMIPSLRDNLVLLPHPRSQSWDCILTPAFPKGSTEPCAGPAQTPLPASFYWCNFVAERVNRVYDGYITVVFMLVVVTIMVRLKQQVSAMLYLISRKKFWAMIQEKAAGPAVLVAIAFLF